SLPILRSNPAGRRATRFIRFVRSISHVSSEFSVLRVVSILPPLPRATGENWFGKMALTSRSDNDHIVTLSSGLAVASQRLSGEKIGSCVPVIAGRKSLLLGCSVTSQTATVWSLLPLTRKRPSAEKARDQTSLL